MADVAGVVAEFARLVDGLSPHIGKAVLKSLKAYELGMIDTAELHGLIVNLIMESNAYARGAADIIASVIIREYTGTAPLPTGRTAVIAPEEHARLHKAVGTVLTGLAVGADITTRLVRLGTSEVEQAVQGQVTTAYENAGIVGWRRQLEPDACELCRSWAEVGVLPTSTVPLHHAGCKCVPVPVTEGDQE